MKYILLCILTLSAGTATAQGRYMQNWYFGKNAVLDFSSNPPTVKNDNVMDAYSGSVCISDSATGKLLLYTDGKSVWNGSHQLIGPIGIPTGELVILPLRSRPGVYALISNQRWYHVDLNTKGGPGLIVAQGKIPFSSPINRVTAVKHCFNQDYWIITVENQGVNAGAFAAIRMRPDGSFTGLTRTPFTGIPMSSYCGDLVSNAAGTKLAITNYNAGGTVITADFDKKCGLAGKIESLPVIAGTDYPFGAAFSPNGRFLYISYSVAASQLVQFEVDNWSANVTVATSGENFNQIMPGPDGRLWITTHISGVPSGKMDVLHNPDSKGAASSYQENFLNMGQFKNTNFHVPNFVMSHKGGGCVPQEPTVTIDTPNFLCAKTPADFKAIYPAGTYEGAVWYFGDGSSSTLPVTKHTFNLPGVYKGMLELKYCTNFDTIYFTTEVSSGFIFDLGPDTTVCPGQIVTLDPQLPPNSTLMDWSTGEMSPTINVNKSGRYTLTATRGMCQSYDEIRITVLPDIFTALGDNYYICEKDSDLVKLDAGKFKTYLWTPTGDTTQWIIVAKTGAYYVLVSDFRGCEASDGTIVEQRCDMDVWFPNAFTPNGDGLNDVFGPVGHDIVSMHMQIYNRWGEMLFETNDSKKGWDGNFNGRKVPEGKYIYKFLISGNKQKVLMQWAYNGSVNLLR